MASTGNSFSEKIARWKVLINNTRAEVASVPQLATLHSDLEDLLQQVEDLENQQAVMRADLQELNKQRLQLLLDGESLRSRLGAALRATHGFDSERLLEFGLRPHRGRPRRSPSPEVPPPPPPEAVKPSS
jgi:uncharacterized protein YdcH (DUF465 family)